MKRIIILFCFCLRWFHAFSQQWVLDQIAEETDGTEPLSIQSYVYGCLFIVLLFLIYKIGKSLKLLSCSMYKRRLKFVVKVMLFIGVVIYSIVSFYTFQKYSKLKRDAEKKLLSLYKRCDLYVTPTRINNAVFYDEINVRYFDSSDEYIYDALHHLGVFNNSGINGVYYCFNISLSPQITVLMANKDKMDLSADSLNSLYYFVLKPRRIRYFSKDINPQDDVTDAFFSFQNQFINEHMDRLQVVDNAFEDIIESFHNEYFELGAIDNDDPWDGRKVLSDSEYAFQRKYEYQRVNYGNFEIIYTIEETLKYGIKERYDMKTYFGIKDSGNISVVEKHSILVRLYSMYFIVAIILVITFLKNRPNYGLNRN